jgi:hypothetical protein
MDKAVPQEDARCTALSNGLVEVEHVRGYFAIGPCHALRRRRLDEAILKSQSSNLIWFKKDGQSSHLKKKSRLQTPDLKLQDF